MFNKFSLCTISTRGLTVASIQDVKYKSNTNIKKRNLYRTRSLIGFYFANKSIVIHLLFLRFIIN